MVNLLPILTMFDDKYRTNLVNNFNLIADELEAAHERISRDIVEGSTIEEVVDARNGYTRLSERLNEFVTADSLGENISGSPTEAHLTLSDLQTKYPDGATGIHVVTADGNFYFWQNGNWTSGGSYQSTEWLNVITTQDETWEV